MASETPAPGSLPASTTFSTREARSFALPLPLAPHTTLHVQVTRLATSTLVFLTTRTPVDSSSNSSPLGSFVCALPNRSTGSSRSDPVLSTPLIHVPGSQDFATRVAKAIAKRTGKPAYVGCSVSTAGAIMEEEAAALRAAVQAVLQPLEDHMEGQSC